MILKGRDGLGSIFWCPECGTLCQKPDSCSPPNDGKICWQVPEINAPPKEGNCLDSRGNPLHPTVYSNLQKHFPYGEEPDNSYALKSGLDRTCVKCGKCCALSFIHLSPDAIANLAKEEGNSSESKTNAVFMVDNWVCISDMEAKARRVPHGLLSYAYSCKKLADDGTCSCYDERPPVCYNHPKADQSIWASCVFACTEAEKETHLAKKACLTDTVCKEEKVSPRIRHIVNGSIKKNPRAGQTEFLLPGKTDTVVNDDGSITSTRNVSRVHSMVPEPEYLYIYEPMTVKCQYCAAEFSIEDLGDDYYVVEDDEVPVTGICPMCKTPDSVEEDIKYETIEEALVRIPHKKIE
jgi:Fe-S-cluster containining protein